MLKPDNVSCVTPTRSYTDKASQVYSAIVESNIMHWSVPSIKGKMFGLIYWSNFMQYIISVFSSFFSSLFL